MGLLLLLLVVLLAKKASTSARSAESGRLLRLLLLLAKETATSSLLCATECACICWLTESAERTCSAWTCVAGFAPLLVVLQAQLLYGGCTVGG